MEETKRPNVDGVERAMKLMQKAEIKASDEVEKNDVTAEMVMSKVSIVEDGDEVAKSLADRVNALAKEKDISATELLELIVISARGFSAENKPVHPKASGEEDSEIMKHEILPEVDSTGKLKPMEEPEE